MLAHADPSLYPGSLFFPLYPFFSLISCQEVERVEKGRRRKNWQSSKGQLQCLFSTDWCANLSLHTRVLVDSKFLICLTVTVLSTRRPVHKTKQNQPTTTSKTMKPTTLSFLTRRFKAGLWLYHAHMTKLSVIGGKEKKSIVKTTALFVRRVDSLGFSPLSFVLWCLWLRLWARLIFKLYTVNL